MREERDRPGRPPQSTTTPKSSTREYHARDHGDRRRPCVHDRATARTYAAPAMAPVAAADTPSTNPRMIG